MAIYQPSASTERLPPPLPPAVRQETSLPNELVLRQQGVRPETTPGVRRYSPGDMYTTVQGDYIEITRTVIAEEAVFTEEAVFFDPGSGEQNLIEVPPPPAEEPAAYAPEWYFEPPSQGTPETQAWIPPEQPAETAPAFTPPAEEALQPEAAPPAGEWVVDVQYNEDTGEWENIYVWLEPVAAE